MLGCGIMEVGRDGRRPGWAAAGMGGGRDWRRPGWAAGGRSRVTEWIGAAEAAERLGIKQASLYAYVSRGLLGRRREAGSRESLFDADEIARLARKGRPRRSPAGAQLVIESSLTEITGDQLRFRGHDAIELARNTTFEEVATLLWTGALEPDDPAGWLATPQALAAGSAAQAALPAGTLPLERLQVIVPALAATDPLRLHLDRSAVMAAGRALIAGMVGSLPQAGGGPDGVAGGGPDGVAGPGPDGVAGGGPIAR